MDGYKEGLEAYNFKRICEAFFIVHLTHQQQRSRLRETTCPFRDLVLVQSGTQTWYNPSVHSDLSIRVFTFWALDFTCSVT